MISNFHTHTYRCNHAEGTEEEYIIRAIESGFSELGFSDHAPYIFPVKGYVSTFRMDKEQYHDYVSTLIALRDKYADKIKIYIGLETEYYPDIFDENIRFLLSEPIDYMILGQHFTNNEYDGTYVCRPTAMYSEVLARYTEQVAEALNTGLFTYAAHPDLCMFDTKKPEYRRYMKRICDTARSLDLPLEINLLGIERARCYPTEDFFRLAAECGNKVIIGFDAHSPDEVYSDKVKHALQIAEGICKKYGLEKVERPRLIKPEIR